MSVMMSTRGIDAPDSREILRWAILLRVAIFSAVLVPGMVIFFGLESHAIFMRVSFFMAVAASVSLLEYIYTRRGGAIGFQVYSHLLFDLVLISSVVDVTGCVGSNFTFLYILLILEAGIFLHRSGAVLWATISSLVYLLLGIVRFWGEGPLFSDIDSSSFLQASSPSHPLFDVFFPLTLFYFVALTIGAISSRLEREGEKASSLGRELKRLSLETTDILHNIPTGVMTIDLSGRLIFANPACLRLVGVGNEHTVGHPVRNILGERHTALLEVIDRTVEKRVPVVRAEVSVGEKGGKKKILGVSTSLLKGPDGEPLGVTTVFQDISCQKEVNALSRRAMRLKALIELSASLAHEIKNPLAVVSSSLELMERSQSSDERRKVFLMVKKESTRLSHLLEDFLRFARIRVRRWNSIDLWELIEEIKTLIMARHDIASRVTVHYAGFRGDGTDIVWGDAELLKQVFLNLFINAAESIPGKGNIHIRLEDRCAVNVIGQRDGDGYKTVIVEDDGPGFSNEAAGKAFDPFFTTKSGGSGLGLSITQRIVEAHRGKILLSDREPQGTCFSLILPVRKPAIVEERCGARLTGRERS